MTHRINKPRHGALGTSDGPTPVCLEATPLRRASVAEGEEVRIYTLAEVAAEILAECRRKVVPGE